MTPVPLRIPIGVVLMAAACITAYRIGDQTVRRVAVLIAGCWTAAAVAQVLSGQLMGPVIVADIVCGLVILRWAWREEKTWLWLLAGLESGLFLLHAVLFQTPGAPTPPEVIGNNILSTLGLLILLFAALHNRGDSSPS
jgi:peptidoglycan/LPS O-acetylase OafA/YrhL